MKAAIYARISRDRKVTTDDGQRYTMLGVERQVEDCRAMCETLGWDVVEVFVDNDISATTGKARPAYAAMLEAVERGEIEAIVAWHPDRLYRRVLDLEHLVKVCDKRRVPIQTVNAGMVDLTTPTGRLVAGLLAQVAKYEGEHKSERWRRAWKQRREAGVPPPSGPRMFGWTRSGEIIEAEADAIRQAADALLGGAGIMTVCRMWNAAGLRTTRDNEWRPVAMRSLMSNPRLAGWVTQDGEIVAESSWPSILERDTWETIRTMLQTRRTGVRLPRVSSLLGIVHCGECGAAMITARRDKKVRTYRCPSGPARSGRGCTQILAEPVEAIVEGYARTRLLDDPRVHEELTRLWESGGGEIAREIAALEQRLVELRTALADENAPSVSDITRAIARVEDRMAEAQTRLVSAAPFPTPSVVWPDAPERRNALVRLVVSRVWITQADKARSGQFQRDRIRIEPR